MMLTKKNIFMMAAVLSAGSLFAASPQITIFEQNFDKGFKPGNITSGKWAQATYRAMGTPGSFSIVNEPVLSKPHAIKILRNGDNGRFVIIPDKKIPAGHNFTFEFKIWLPSAAGTVLHINSAKGFVGGVLLFADKAVSAYNVNMGWQADDEMPVLPDKQWLGVRVNFDANRGFYTVDVIYPDGKTVKGSVQYPFLNLEPITEWRFVNILPQTCHTFVDDIKLTYDADVSLDGRDDFSGKASTRNKKFTAMLAGKDVYISKGETVELELPSAKLELLTIKTPAGKRKPAYVSARAQNAGSRWIELGKLPVNQSNGAVVFEKIDQILKLQLQFPTNSVISAVGIYSPAGTPQGELDRAWQKKLDAEYRLPVYDLQYAGCDVAEFTMVNHTENPLEVEINMHDRLKDKHLRKFKHTVPVGTSNIKFDLKDLPNGEYVTTVTDISDSDSAGGKFDRLLRLCTSPACAATPRKEITGNKIFFPDGFFLTESENIHFTTGVGKTYKVKSGTNADDSFIVMGMGLGVDKNGNMVVNYRTMNRMWQVASTKTYHAVANLNDLENWQHFDGYFKNFTPVEQVFAQTDLPAAAKPDWARKPGPDGKIKYRFYDPEKDGPINLSQLQCEFVSYASVGQLGYVDFNWGVMRPDAATVWTVWYRSPGEALIVGKTPLVGGFPVSGTLEPTNSGSDLSFGQWLEDDGKTLCFGFGRHLMRAMPYQAQYDNLFDRARIVGIWRTRDGINWEQGYIAPPDANKPPMDQHYGGSAVRMPHGAGLRVCILNRYSAATQQISWEMIYTWDGFRWTRFQNEPQLCGNGEFGSWYHGGGYLLKESPITVNGKTYILMYWCNNSYHFEAEFLHSSTHSVDHVNGEYIKKRYKERHLEKWPFFQKYFYGSWDKVAEHARNAVSSIGIIELRKDGFFYAVAKDKPARMLTSVLTASNDMKMNAVIKENGYIEVSLLDASGNVINGYTKRFDSGDDTNWQVFEDLPTGEFQVELKLRNAEIYTLNF